MSSRPALKTFPEAAKHATLTTISNGTNTVRPRMPELAIEEQSSTSPPSCALANRLRCNGFSFLLPKLATVGLRSDMAHRLRSPPMDAPPLAPHPSEELMALTRFVLIAAVAVMTSVDMPAYAASPYTQDAARHLYDRVMEEYRHRDYQAALAGFQFFLELHGKSGLAPSARYWVGECQYRLGRYEQAMTTFSDLVSYYPFNPKMAATTLKIGMTHAKMGQTDEARITFQRVVAEWPDSMEADVARKELSKYGPTGERDPDTQP